MTAAARCVRFVDRIQLTPVEAQLLAKVSVSVHRRVLALSERIDVHPNVIYRDAFDAGLTRCLEAALDRAIR